MAGDDDHATEITETLCRALMENVTMGVVFIDRDHRIVQLNQAQADLYNLDIEQSVGKPCFAVFEGRDEICPHCPGVEAMNRGLPFTCHKKPRLADGRELHLRIRAIPTHGPGGQPGGFVELVEDITAQRQLEHQLGLTQFAVENAATAAYWLHKDGSLFYVNKLAEQTLGYTRDELLTMRVFDISAGMTPELWPAYWEAVKRGDLSVFEAFHRHKDGTLIPVEIVANIVQFEGEEYNTAFARDIRERKQAEAQRRQLEAQLQHSQKLESLGVLAGGIAHDFNNILMGVMGNAELAQIKLGEGHPVAENLRRIETAAQRASNLAGQMLAYSGKGQLAVKPVDLNAALEEMGDLVQSAVAKTARYEQHLGAELPRILADPMQIRQIVVNLITNASEALEERDGLVTLSTGVADITRQELARSVHDETLHPGRYIYLEIADTGCGIPETDLDKIFDPFFTTKFTGRGLGLAAVLGIVRGHHGAIRVESERGKGTRIRVILPCEPQPLETGEPYSQPVEEHIVGAPKPQTTPKKPTLLVVDDEPTIRALAKNTLDSEGYRVLTASDGSDALAKLLQAPDDIDLIVLDMTMPVMSGAETYQKIRAIRPYIKIILSSGYEPERTLKNIPCHPNQTFLQKPYLPSTLLEKIWEMLG